MSDQETILQFMKTAGPVLPNQVAKHINSNILLASAHLSELSSNGKVKVSKLKVGGSPLYYLPEHRDKLQNFTHNFNPKDQETLKQLKEKKVLQEKNLALLTRVSLRGLKDFALPLNLTLNQQKELFWKWFLLSDQEAIDLVKSQFNFRPVPVLTPSPALPISTPISPSRPLPTTAVPLTPESAPSPTSEIQTPLEHKKPYLENKEPEEQKTEKKSFTQKLKEKFKPRKKTVEDQFTPIIEDFFKERNIEIESKDHIRKNTEIDFFVRVPSVVGKLTYFCKAKNKKRCDEKDLSAAYMEAQTKKKPLLFLYTNEISKKAQEMIDTGAFENLLIKKLE